jgi:hypothetical protein
LRVAARLGEPESARATREKIARSQLEDGRKALADRQFDAAITAFQFAMTLSGRADYGIQPNEAASMLRQARNNKAAAEATQRHANAQRLVDEAKGLAGSDVAGALLKLRDARTLDPDVEGAADLTNNLAEQARIQGESALISARNLDSGSRIADAIREYERAVRLLDALPNGHKDLAFARQRLGEWIVTPEQHAKKEIEALVETYCAAFDTLDPKRIQAVFPLANVEVLNNQFKNYKSLRCSITSPLEYERFDVNRASGAQLRFGMKQTIVMKAGGAPSTSELNVTMRVARADAQKPWLIDRVDFEVKPPK